MNRLNAISFVVRTLSGIALAIACLSAQAQYTRPGAAVPARPLPVQPAAAVSPPMQGNPPGVIAAPGPISPDCFEVIDARDTTLIAVLRANALLCQSATRSGTPVRLKAAPGGDLSSEDKGPPTPLMRKR